MKIPPYIINYWSESSTLIDIAVNGSDSNIRGTVYYTIGKGLTCYICGHIMLTSHAVIEDMKSLHPFIQIKSKRGHF